MKLTEKILIGLIIIGVILRMLLVSWSWVFMYIPLYFLVVIYYPLGFCFFNSIRLREMFKKVSYKGISTWRIIGGIGLGLCHFSAITGVIFDINGLPGAGPLTIFGFISGVIILIISLVKFRKNKIPFYINAIKRVSVLVLLSGSLFFMPNKYMVEFFMRNHPEYIEAYREYKKDITNEVAAENLEREYKKATLSKEKYEEYLNSKKEEAVIKAPMIEDTEEPIAIEVNTNAIYVYIKKVRKSHGDLFLDVEHVDYLTGEAAAEQEKKDKAYFIDGEDTITNINDGYYISRLETESTVLLSNCFYVEYIIDDDGMHEMEAPRIITEELLLGYVEDQALLKIQVIDGEAKWIAERFMP